MQKQEKQGDEFQMQKLRERLFSMEERQCKMVSFLAQVLEKPELPLSIVPAVVDTRSKKRRLLGPDCFDDKANHEENPIISSQAVIGEDTNTDANSLSILNMEACEFLESSLDNWENILYEVGRSSNEIPTQPSCIVLTEMNQSSEVVIVNFQR